MGNAIQGMLYNSAGVLDLLGFGEGFTLYRVRQSIWIICLVLLEMFPCCLLILEMIFSLFAHIRNDFLVDSFVRIGLR